MKAGDRMTEIKAPEKKSLWSSALKVVKGDSTAQLMEDFTAEMTLVAEGLCEDQAKLRQAVDQAMSETDRISQRTKSEVEALETTIRENQRDLDRRLDDLTRRLDAMENREKAIRAEQEKSRGKHTWLARPEGLIGQLTVLASIIAGAWVLVSILNLFK